MNQKEKTLNDNSFVKKTEFSLILIIALIFIVCTFGTPSFFSQYNLTNLLKQCSIIGIIAVSSTFIIITGGIDLSCGSICGLSGLATALLLTKSQLPIFAVVLIAVFVGVLCGLYNGAIIHEFKVPPFIATLGTMTIVRGLIEVISNAQTIAGLPDSFSAFSNESFLGIPKLALIWIAVILIAFFILKLTIFGRNLYVIGSGQEVARLSGINLRLNTYAVYAFAGLLCGLAGVLLTARINSAVPTGGQGYEMDAIAATVIGGGSLAGAKGTAVGTALGTVLMILIDNGGIQFGLNTFIMQIITGALITIAVIIDMSRNRKA